MTIKLLNPEKNEFDIFFDLTSVIHNHKTSCKMYTKKGRFSGLRINSNWDEFGEIFCYVNKYIYFKMLSKSYLGIVNARYYALPSRNSPEWWIYIHNINEVINIDSKIILEI